MKPNIRPIELTSLVWRISVSAPMGEWVRKGARPLCPSAADLPKVSMENWSSSSLDLLDGSAVTGPDNSGTDDLFDEFFGPALKLTDR